MPATSTIDLTPQVSSTNTGGMVINPNVVGNNAWREAAIDILAYQWASTPLDQRDQFLQPYWSQGNYGSVDMTDRPGADGNVYSSPQTVAALSRYIASYVPGSNPQLEGVIPYVPPAPNEYIESPDAVANRVNQFNIDRNYALDVAQENRLAAGQAASIAASGRASASASADRQAAAKAQIAAAKIGADASKYGTQGQFKSSIFNTNAGLWGANESNLLAAMRDAGSLGLGYQGLLDERTNNIIKNLSNPADFVERMSSIRALQAPNPEQVAAYQNVPELQGSLSKLYNYKPSAQPVAPTLDGSASGTNPPPAPRPKRPRRPEGGGMARGGVTTDPVFMVGDKGVPAQKDTTEMVISHTPGAEYEVIPMNKDGRNLAQTMRGYAGGTPIDYTDNTPGPSAPANPTDSSPTGYSPIDWDEIYASGYGPARDANPYASQQTYISNDNQRVVRIDPATGMQYKVWGVAPTSNNLSRSYRPNVDMRKYGLENRNGRDYTIRPLGEGTVTTPTGGEQPGPATTPGWGETPGGTGIPAPVVPPGATPTVDTPAGPVNPNTGRVGAVPETPGAYIPDAVGAPREMGNIPVGYYVDPVTGALRPGQAPPAGSLPAGQPGAPGTPPAGLGGAPAGWDGTTFNNYTNAQIQDLPFLRYLQGIMDPATYNTMSNLYTTGPFGTMLPEAGAINLQKMYEILQDEDAAGMLQSLYKGGNSNLQSLLSMALARAPIGNARATSAIET